MQELPTSHLYSRHSRPLGEVTWVGGAARPSILWLRQPPTRILPHESAVSTPSLASRGFLFMLRKPRECAIVRV